ncbi:MULTISPECIES: type II toxin-antitoxin system RelE/ParE family toxin [Pseudomonas]|uniref:type II toxin-antitoxin system RelE/ParE family toxin n=1 Tax=Pseudomonas TaxID=286 RepID=UPI002114102C|nr:MULTISPECIES: type II toxin-antitoxin system RelE/ParE family toxin [unclassified Pseudomonas]
MDMPTEVQEVFGYALHLAQEGGKHSQAKPMKGLTSSGVLEVVEDFDGDTYRAVYTVKIGEAIYALHTFKKKSNKGIATPKHEIDLIKARIKDAEEHAKRQKK